MDRSQLAIIIPAWNEAATLGTVVERACQEGTVIVVDDASQDGTADVARKAGAVVVIHSVNRGYDSALNTGFTKAAELGCRYIITVDADGQHDPSLIAQYRRHLSDGVQLVLGVRDRRQRIGEHVFAWATSLLYGVQDPLCGMKGYDIQLYQSLGHFDSYGSVGTELTLFGLRKKCRSVQVPIPTRKRDGVPRFGRTLKGNYKIFRSLWIGLCNSHA